MEAGFEAGAGEEAGEGELVVVAALGADALGEGGAAELGGDQQQGVLEESAFLEVLDQAGEGPIEGPGLGGVVVDDVLVAVPVDPGGAEGPAVVELDEANAALDQTPGQQAVAAEAVGVGLLQAVELAGGGGFVLEPDGLGDAGLHPGGEFVGADPGREGGVPGVLVLERPIHPVEHRHADLAVGLGERAGGEEVGDRLAGGPEGHPLVRGGEETGRPVDCPARRLATGVGQDDEGGQVLVVGPQAVRQPRPQGGEAVEGEAGVHQEGGRRVVRGLAVHRMDEGQVVDPLRQVGEQRTDPRPRLAVLPERERRLHQPARAAEEGVDLALAGEFLALELRQVGLVVEGVDVAQAPGAEDLDDSLGLRWIVQRFQPFASGPCGAFILQQPGEGHRGQAAGGLGQELPAREVAERDRVVRGRHRWPRRRVRGGRGTRPRSGASSPAFPGRSTSPGRAIPYALPRSACG